MADAAKPGQNALGKHGLLIRSLALAAMILLPYLLYLAAEALQQGFAILCLGLMSLVMLVAMWIC